MIANVVAHKIVAKHTNRPESSHFLQSEIIEYRSQTEKLAGNFYWNDEDRTHIEENALELIKKKLAVKYSDVAYSAQEAVDELKEVMNSMLD